MADEKFLDAGKQADKPQDKSADELLSEKDLDNVAGGDAGSTGHGAGIGEFLPPSPDSGH